MKDAAHIKKLFLILLAACLLACFPLAAQSSSTSKVIIDSAHRTEYYKETETGDELINFTGEVSLKVDKNGQNVEIQAETVLYNRTQSTLYAEGNIVFSRSTGGKNTEKLTARTLLFDIDTLDGIFDQGRVVQEQSDSINLPSGSSLYVASDLFGRDNSGTVAFDSGTLTFCDDPDPHWKIKATRIWLLPGNEFSFFNAVLYVGHLPVMYFPFFYYPKDEMFFNPVFSYDARRGYSFQTTTYIIGRKTPAKGKDDDGLFSFMRTTEIKKQERDGLFLRNLDEDDTIPSESLKIMADIYSNLGVMAGAEGVFKPDSVISDISFKAYIGFSNVISPVGGQYTTLYAGKRKTNWSYLLGMKIPFRFYGDFSMKISKSPITLNISLPLYSDCSFETDFLNRSESMDWINYLLKNPALISGDSASSSGGSEKTSFTWDFKASVSTPSFIKNLNPYIKSFSISSINSSVSFSSKTNQGGSGASAKFFYPSSVTPLKLSLSLSGTLLSSDSGKNSSKTSSSTQSSAKKDSSKAGKGDAAELETPPDLVLPETEKQEYEEIPADMMPALSVTIPKQTTLSDFSYSLTYTLSPSVSTEVTYNSDSWSSPDKIDLKNIKHSYLSLKSPLTLKDSISWKNSFLSFSNSVSIQPEYQSHPDVSETGSALESLRKTEYKGRKLDMSTVSSLSLKPFILMPAFAESSLSWNSTIKLIRTRFNGSATEPEWDFLKTEWDPDSITSHDMTLVLSVKEGILNPKFTLKANLPPQTESYSGTLSFGYSFLSSFSVSSTLKRKSKTDDTWVFSPLTQSSKWSFLDKKLSLSESYKYDIENKHSDSLSLSLSGYGVTSSFNMGWTKPYELKTDSQGGSWVALDKEKFIPKSASLSYSLSSTTLYAWYNRISFSPALSTSLNFDLLRPTDSSFVFTPSFTYKINKALDITFSAESRNQVLFRYVQDYFNYDAKMAGESNMLKDLLNSFAFWNTDLRKASGFKLKKISIKLTHELHDWVLNSEFRVEPRLLKDTTPYHYDFTPYFSLSVVWRPMSSMKTTIQDKYGTFVLNPE